MSFVDHDCELTPSVLISNLIQNPRELLHGADDDLLARLDEFSQITADTDGMSDYGGEFKRDFVLNDLAHNVLARQCKEFALDVHLLNRACYTSIAERWGESVLADIGIEQWRSMAPVTVQRLRKVFNIAGDSMASILKVLQLNPFFPRDYLKLGFEQVDDTVGRMWVADCAALQESDARGIVSLMTHSPESPGFDAMAKAVNPFVQVSQMDASGIPGARLAWELRIDTTASPDVPSKYAELVAGADLMGLDNAVHEYHY